MIIKREDYPRPDLIRENWVDLNGNWKFCFDDGDIGRKQRWFEKGINGTHRIKVPFCYQSQAGGVEDSEYHEILWYERTITIPVNQKGSRCLLHFGAVDYEMSAWVNGDYAGSHVGGSCAFTLDITDQVRYGEDNRITLRVWDGRECWLPRGKQYWKQECDRIWYTPVSGIWKNVWMEFTGGLYVTRMLLTPDIDARCVRAEITLNRVPREKALCRAEISHEGCQTKELTFTLSGRNQFITIDLEEEDYADEIQYWSPDNPWLYDIDLSLMEEGCCTDHVSGYFGMRKISMRGSRILLNNKPYYQKLVLDQGYWRDTLLTPPDVASLEKDILLAKEMGFNGARKHQKVESAAYYYLADKLGFLVWAEYPSAYRFCTMEMERLWDEWTQMVSELYNHPSVIVWVPLNESWGVRNIVTDPKQQKFASSLYEMTKAFDISRLVSNNDGWEQVTESDICGVHDYTAEGGELEKKFTCHTEALFDGAAEHRLLFAEGHRYEEKPVLLTEFGGIAFEQEEGWGYNGTVADEEAFLRRFNGIVRAAQNASILSGYCYTQLTDVFQEANGLLTMDRKPKVDPANIRMINDGQFEPA